MPIQTAADSISNSVGSPFGFKNRIINGAMVIDQRNAGASVTPAPTYQYTIDRWEFTVTQSSKLTTQQNAGSVTPPAGFTNYLGVTSSSAYSVTATDRFNISQYIEGYNLADLAWGTANAKTITISAWVYSSLTGTFGGCVVAYGSSSQYYPFTYTISSANTWTQISVTVPGNTTTAIYTNNSVGVILQFGLGVGSTYSGTAGAWSSTEYRSATGATSVVGTSGATFYITGVQLEKGSQATAFDYRDYGNELRLCQRYCYTIRGVYYTRRLTIGSSTNNMIWNPQHPVPMRTTPTLLTSNFTSSTIEGFNYSTGAPTGALTVIGMSEGDNYVAQVDMTFASGISSGQSVCWRWIGSPTAYVGFQAEL